MIYLKAKGQRTGWPTAGQRTELEYLNTQDCTIPQPNLQDPLSPATIAERLAWWFYDRCQSSPQTTAKEFSHNFDRFLAMLDLEAYFRLRRGVTL